MALEYSTVRVNITTIAADGIDFDDIPDDTPLTGTLELAPMIAAGSAIQYDDSGTLKLKTVSPVTVDIGITGDIAHQGRDYVKVLAPTASTTNLAQLQWRASFKNLRFGSQVIAMQPIYFYATPGTEINLADHVNVAPSSLAVQLSRGPRGFGIGQVETDSATDEVVFKLDDEFGTEVGRATLPNTVSDFAVAELIIEGTETKSLLDAAYASAASITAVETSKLDKDEAAETYVTPELVATAVGVIAPENSMRAVGKNELMFNVKDYGAKGNGVTNDTASINAAIAAMPSIANSWGAGAAGVLYLPAGRYLVDGGIVIPSNKRMQVRGAGPYVTILNQRSGQTSDLLTINAANSGIENLTLAGSRDNSAGDLLVLNAGYTYARNCTLSGANSNAITVGKAGAAIVHRLSDINIREPRGYGIYTTPGSGCTDGQWMNIDIGLSGLSAVRTETGNQMMTNVHVWGAGMESDTDKSGFWLGSTNNQLIGCQSESNRGYGVTITPSGSNGHMLIGCKVWGNGAAGINAFRIQKLVVSGCAIYRNCVNNTSGTTAFSYAAIANDGGTEWSISGNNIWDDGVAIPVGPTGYTYSFAGRSSGLAQQSSAYREQGAADFNSLTGNTMRAERTRSGIPVVLMGSNSAESGNVLGATAPVPTIAAASTVSVTSGVSYVEVTGTTVISSVAASKVGRVVTFVFTDAIPGGMLDGSGTLRLASNFSPAQGGAITLVCGGSSWHEVARSSS